MKRKWYREKYYPRISKMVEYRINKSVSGMIYEALKHKKAGKKWEKLVGYGLKELMEHLEKQFTPEMNWDNYGTYWVIDHIIPRCFFVFNSPEDEEFKKCWSLENLRPLPKEENYQKMLV
ncbi:MAG: HNH endonuclease signature motif containing protein, partial [candidate division WOR-3 bacterium]